MYQSTASLRCAAAKATNEVSTPSLTRGAYKEIKFSNEGRASILKGADVLALMDLRLLKVHTANLISLPLFNPCIQMALP